jgi:hypothetical protein
MKKISVCPSDYRKKNNEVGFQYLWFLPLARLLSLSFLLLSVQGPRNLKLVPENVQAFTFVFI